MCLNEAKELDIPVGIINGIGWSKLDNGWGICIRYTDTNTFDIGISTECQRKVIVVDDLKAIILHEILHTCAGCFDHSKLWVKYALKIDDIYGHSVSVFKTTYDFLHPDSPVLHRMVCENCGGIYEIKDPYVWEKIQNGTTAHCGWCGKNF